MCAKAKNAVRADLLKGVGFEGTLTTGAICVYPNLVPFAAKALQGTPATHIRHPQAPHGMCACGPRTHAMGSLERVCR